MFRRIAIEGCCHLSNAIFSRGNLYVGHILGKLLWHIFQQDSFCSESYCFLNEAVSINLCSFHGNEQLTVFYASAVDVDTCYLSVNITFDIERAQVLDKVF